MSEVATKPAAAPVAAALREEDLHPGEAVLSGVSLARNLLAWLYILVTCLVLGGPVVFIQGVLFPFGLANRWGDFTVFWWTQVFLWLWRVEFVGEGLEHVDPKRTYVLASNHRSHLDALAALYILKHTLRFGFIMKRSLSLIPVFGWFIWMNGYVPIDRGSSTRRDQLATGVKYLKKGRSVMMYPEGTRAPDHRFRTFRKGAVVLALRAQVPLLPVVVSGSGHQWPKTSLFIRPGRVRVEILPPIETAGRGMEDRDELLKELKTAIVRRYRTSPEAPPLEERPELLEVLGARA
jgi:1-acyl-sn-glycerol-3-phosphate acyltransferase